SSCASGVRNGAPPDIALQRIPEHSRLRAMLLALVLAAAAPFFADPLVPAALGPIDPRPGSWAEYLVRTRGREDVRVRATALAAEGQRRYWLELTAAGESGIAWAARLLRQGERPSLTDVERID